MATVRTDYLLIMIATLALAALGFYILSTEKTLPPEHYQTVSNIGTLIVVTSSIVVVYCAYKFLTYTPPERPYTPPLKPVQIPPAYILYAARRSGRRPEEFMVRGE